MGLKARERTLLYYLWSSQNELVNDFDRFDWRRLRMYVD